MNPLPFLVRELLRRRRKECGIDRMILTGGNRGIQRDPCAGVTASTTKLTYLHFGMVKIK
jgi:hypothetical protein